MAIESRGDLAARHGSIVRIAVAHSWSYRSDNPICTRTVHRRMVRQALADANPPARKRPERKKLRLGPVMEFIDAILESDRKAPRKRRHTSHRIWERIRPGVAGGIGLGNPRCAAASSLKDWSDPLPSPAARRRAARRHLTHPRRAADRIVRRRGPSGEATGIILGDGQ